MLVCVKERRNLSVFAGNCLLWDHIQKNNGSSVFLLNQMVLLWLTLDSGNWNSQFSEVNVATTMKTFLKNHMTTLNFMPFGLCTKRVNGGYSVQTPLRTNHGSLLLNYYYYIIMYYELTSVFVLSGVCGCQSLRFYISICQYHKDWIAP